MCEAQKLLPLQSILRINIYIYLYFIFVSQQAINELDEVLMNVTRREGRQR